MTKRVTATQAKAKLLGLLDQVSEGDTVEITKRGRVVARLVQASTWRATKGSMRGTAVSADPDDDLLTTGETWNCQ